MNIPTATATATNPTTTTPLPFPPSSFITALEHNKGSLYVGSIAGEFRIYKNISSKSTSNSISNENPYQWKFDKPILGIVFFENKIFILHPNNITLYDNDNNNDNKIFNTLEKFNLKDNEKSYQCIKINQESNILILGINDGTILMYNLPDLIIIDKYDISNDLNNSNKLQNFDLFNYFLIISISNGSNILFDISNKNFFKLGIQDSGFKYPITTDLKFLNNESNFNDIPPYELIYAQSGIEGKISVIKLKIELQTDPTVTINTAAKIAPISSCINPSGLIINKENTEKFIFKAHRSKLNSIIEKAEEKV
ncbi:hypothetical protein C6P40_003675, partial [Pichia californica]